MYKVVLSILIIVSLMRIKINFKIKNLCELLFVLYRVCTTVSVQCTIHVCMYNTHTCHVHVCSTSSTSSTTVTVVHVLHECSN